MYQNSDDWHNWLCSKMYKVGGNMWCISTRQGTNCTGLFWDMENWSWHRVKNNSSVDFDIFVRIHTLICFLSPPCNFGLIFKHFTQKNSAFSAAYHIQNYRNRKLYRPISQKSHFQTPEKPLTVFRHNWSYLRKKEEYGLDFDLKIKLKCAPYNDTKNLFYPKCSLFPVLWDCIT